MSLICGVDPGQTGAIALLNADTKKIIEIVDMPVTTRLSGKGKEVNAYMLSNIFKNMNKYLLDIETIIIERVHAMKGQGTTSMFNFGRSLGVVEGIIAMTNTPTVWVTPQTWKKKFGLLKKEKDAARSLVISMYPNQLDLFKRKKDIGRADAVLIGLYKQ